MARRDGGVPVVRGPRPRTEDVLEAIRQAGAVVVEGIVSADPLESLRSELRALVAGAPFGTNPFDGFATRRVFDPLARTRALDDLVRHPSVLEAIEDAIGPCQLGMTVVSEVGPGEVAQRPHRDGSVYPLPEGFGPFMINAIWAVDEFTATNGATVVALSSHHSTVSSAAPSWSLVPVVMPAGSVLLYDGRSVHGAGANRGSTPRLGLIVEYVARWLRPNENHTLAVPCDTARRLDPDLQELLGYNQLGAHLGFVAGQPPRQWLAAH